MSAFFAWEIIRPGRALGKLERVPVLHRTQRHFPPVFGPTGRYTGKHGDCEVSVGRWCSHGWTVVKRGEDPPPAPFSIVKIQRALAARDAAILETTLTELEGEEG